MQSNNVKYFLERGGIFAVKGQYERNAKKEQIYFAKTYVQYKKNANNIASVIKIQQIQTILVKYKVF